MEYHIRVTKHQYAEIPLLLRNVGIDCLQEPINRPEGMPLWQIFYGVSGEGEFVFEGQRNILQEGQAVLLYPHSGHSYHKLQDSWTVHYVGFNGSACLKFLSGLGLKESGVYHLTDSSIFPSHIRKISEIHDSASGHKELSYSKELYSMLLDFSSSAFHVKHTDSGQETGVVKDVIYYLEKHFAEEISLTDLAEQFCMTPEYLCTLFREQTGDNLIPYLNKVRVGKARIFLMESPDQTVREIGERCGFHSPSYFGKVFREFTGMTPQGYRKG
ncbi:MAG: helix-turn-helix domain-containing protein [Blautia sp.]|nr:helix-turn-helix domain-containing protein [Blautia sp.]